MGIRRDPLKDAKRALAYHLRDTDLTPEQFLSPYRDRDGDSEHLQQVYELFKEMI